jgi:hypothetical protein
VRSRIRCIHHLFTGGTTHAPAAAVYASSDEDMNMNDRIEGARAAAPGAKP